MHNAPVLSRYIDTNNRNAEVGFALLKQQDVEPIMKAIAEMPDHMVKQRINASQKYIGSVPNVMAVAWAKEWGVRLYSREWTEKARKRLDDPDYAALRIKL